MYRRRRVLIFSAAAALAGSLALFSSILWISWKESLTSEEAYAGGLAAALGRRAQQEILDTRDMLAGLNALALAHCSPAHLRAMQDAGASRPYIRAIGYWRANRRLCGTGFAQNGLRPARADRIYDSGLVAWWPSPQTRLGGTEMFLMRYGDYDAAIDPHMLLDLGPIEDRRAALWVDGLPMTVAPPGASLPPPPSLPPGVSVDRAHERVLSRYTQNSVLPMNVVAAEPLRRVVDRHAQTLLTGAALGLLLVGAWCYLVVRVWRHELSLATRMRRALSAGQIRVHYQPVVDMVSGCCVGAEALARWELEDHEQISPAIFIPVAEQAGLIQDLTAAVLRQVVRDLRALLTEHPHMSVNVNLSPDDLRSDRIARELKACLEESGLKPANIKLEITERALIDTETSRALIRDLRRRGHQIAIDDFGTGYSSLSYLQAFELDILKIDKAFVDAIGTQAATSQVIVHVIDMARSLGLETVAEGVATPAHVAWLIDHGVAFGQGFLFSRPLSCGDFHDFFHASLGRDLVAA
ncbi:MAG TPA: EAL domain-containing protein [Steroidobacteraceae bacterium]|nr:EAL domain-containing protein [Steroidobacteraceae bacterium]